MLQFNQRVVLIFVGFCGVRLGFFTKFALFLKVTFPSLHVQDKEKSLVTF